MLTGRFYQGEDSWVGDWVGDLLDYIPGFNTWGREGQEEGLERGRVSCTIILVNYKHLGPTTPSLFSRTPCSWDSHIAPFRPWANQPSHLLQPMSPLIPLPWATSLSTRIGWPGKLPKALPVDRISSHYCLSRIPLSEVVLLPQLICNFHPCTNWSPHEPGLGVFSISGSWRMSQGPPMLKSRWGRTAGMKTGGWHVGLS